MSLGFAVMLLRCFLSLCVLFGSLRAWHLRVLTLLGIPTRVCYAYCAKTVPDLSAALLASMLVDGHVGACGCNIKMFRTIAFAGSCFFSFIVRLCRATRASTLLCRLMLARCEGIEQMCWSSQFGFVLHEHRPALQTCFPGVRYVCVSLIARGCAVVLPSGCKGTAAEVALAVKVPLQKSQFFFPPTHPPAHLGLPAGA